MFAQPRLLAVQIGTLQHICAIPFRKHARVKQFFQLINAHGGTVLPQLSQIPMARFQRRDRLCILLVGYDDPDRRCVDQVKFLCNGFEINGKALPCAACGKVFHRLPLRTIENIEILPNALRVRKRMCPMFPQDSLGDIGADLQIAA